MARREYDAYGLPFDDFAHSVGSLAEACTVIRRLSTETEPFDFQGTYIQLTGAFCNPKPIQRPSPPILIGGRSAPVLRIVAEHADLWNIPGGDIDDAISRSALLDRYCAEIGRDPATVTRSIHLPASYDQPSTTRDAIGEAIGAGFRPSFLDCPRPSPLTSRSGSPTRSSPRRRSTPARREENSASRPGGFYGDSGLTSLVTTQRCLPILRFRANPSLS